MMTVRLAGSAAACRLDKPRINDANSASRVSRGSISSSKPIRSGRAVRRLQLRVAQLRGEVLASMRRVARPNLTPRPPVKIGAADPSALAIPDRVAHRAASHMYPTGYSS